MANYTAFECPLLLVTWHESYSNRATTISSIVAVVVQMIIIPFAVFLNGATIFLIIKFESLQKERFIIVGLLSLTDFISGLIAQPLFVAKELYRLVNKETNCALDTAFYYSEAMFGLVTIFQITCLTYERYVAITDSFNYNSRISSRRFFQLAGANWAVNILFMALYVILPTIHDFYLSITIAVFVFLCCLCFTYWNIRIFSVLRRHSADIAKQQQSVNGEQKLLYLAKRKNAITVMYIFGAFMLVNVPIIVNYAYLDFFANDEIRTWLYFAFLPRVDVSLHLNSILCPLIYGLRTKEFRKRFLRYFLGINQDVGVLEEHVPAPATGTALAATNVTESDKSTAKSNISNEKE